MTHPTCGRLKADACPPLSTLLFPISTNFICNQIIHQKTKRGRKTRRDRYYLTKKPQRVQDSGLIGKIVKLGEFETFPVEESQLQGGQSSVIRKLESIPRSSVNGLLGTQGRAVPRARGRCLLCPWAGTGFWSELSQVVILGSQKHQVIRSQGNPSVL